MMLDKIGIIGNTHGVNESASPARKNAPPVMTDVGATVILPKRLKALIRLFALNHLMRAQLLFTTRFRVM